MLEQIFILLFLGLAILYVVIIIALPTAIAFFINRWLKKIGINYIGLFLLIITPIWTAYEVYTAIYPTDNFYFSEFKQVTLRDAPKSATIIRKNASYPDFHGDYCSTSLMTLSAAEYKKLLNDLTNDERLTKIRQDEINASSELDEIMGDFKQNNILHCFIRNIAGKDNKYYMLGFLDDKKTIIVYVLEM